jgi:hypothetical protein
MKPFLIVFAQLVTVGTALAAPYLVAVSGTNTTSIPAGWSAQLITGSAAWTQQGAGPTNLSTIYCADFFNCPVVFPLVVGPGTFSPIVQGYSGTLEIFPPVAKASEVIWYNSGSLATIEVSQDLLKWTSFGLQEPVLKGINPIESMFLRLRISEPNSNSISGFAEVARSSTILTVGSFEIPPGFAAEVELPAPAPQQLATDVSVVWEGFTNNFEEYVQSPGIQTPKLPATIVGPATILGNWQIRLHPPATRSTNLAIPTGKYIIGAVLEGAPDLMSWTDIRAYSIPLPWAITNAAPTAFLRLLVR